MKPYFGMSSNPSDYAWELVERLGFKDALVGSWVKLVLQELGLKWKPYSGSLFFPSLEENESIQSAERQKRPFNNEPECPIVPYRQQRPIDAALWGDTVFVDTDFHLERQRLATCHEVGHFYPPWHEGLSYVKNGCIVEPPGMRQNEIEANRFAADLLMPPPFFREDMDSLPFGIRSVERLSWKYLTSLEATARHYVDLSPKSCALVVIEALPKDKITQNGSWLKVKYCTRSRSFDHFIRPGTEIAPDTAIAQASLMSPGTIHTDEAPGWVLGLRPERRLILHCRPWGKKGDVLVLVEEPRGNQWRLF